MLVVLQVAAGAFIGALLAAIVAQFFNLDKEQASGEMSVGCVLAIIIVAVLGAGVWYFGK